MGSHPRAASRIAFLLIWLALAAGLLKAECFERAPAAGSKARVGERDHALRFWQTAAAMNLTQIQALSELAGYGLRDDLVAFYRELQVELPTSEIPAKALRELLPQSSWPTEEQP